MKAKEPFFVKFLESSSKDELEKTRAGATMKYPSDTDELVTDKYPSDDDEIVTQKYPSDDDESILTDKYAVDIIEAY